MLVFLYLINALIIYKIYKMSELIDQLKTEMSALRETIATEKAQVAEKITNLEASITALEEQIAGNGTSEDLQALINDVKAAAAEVRGIVAAPGEE